MASRRLFLTGGAAAAALTLIGSETLVQPASAAPGTTAPVAPPASHSAHPAGMAGMDHSAGKAGGVTKSFLHRGKKVDITVSDSMAMATVDERTSVHLERWSATEFHSHGLPFQVYSDPTQLLKALLDAEAAELIIL